MNRAAGVVVLYNPDSNVIENIRTYLDQVSFLTIIDNSEIPVRDLVEQLKVLRGAEYLSKGQNLGVANALNEGAGRAIEKGCRYLLTMDQDSAASEGMVERLVSYADNHESVGLISAFHFDRQAQVSPPPVEYEEVVTTMTSGSVVDLVAYSAVGGFLDRLFIDYVDDEYCLRLQLQGWKVVRANSVLLYHSLGHMTPRPLFGRTVRPTHHAPTRYYYQTRNRMYVASIYGKQFPSYARLERRRHMGRLVKMLLFERGRYQKIRYVILGFIAGLRGHFGRLQGS